MSKFGTALRAKYLALSVGAAVVTAFASPAQAIILNDVYWGGQIVNAPTNSDIIGNPSHFDIFSMEVTRIATGLDSSDLKIVINTNYNPNSANALGTGFGDLFIGSAGNSGNLVLDGTGGAPPYANDTYNANKARFDYVASIDNNPLPGVGGTATVHALATGGSAGSDVQQSFAPPAPGGNPDIGFGFRNEQAAYYTGAGSDLTGGNSTWAFSAGAQTLTILIKGEETGGVKLFGDGLILLAWAFTCANDVILGQVQSPPHVDQPVPLPAGFLLMGTVLLGGGGIAQWRRRRTRRAS
jgi:hypothetical protein